MEKIIASWRSVKPEENRFRFYSISLGEDLWGEEVLVKRWGRIGERKRENYIWPDSHQELINLIDDIKEDRNNHGYELDKGFFSN
ncbi:WGR domain-containing protein [Candidatus Bipolaricaulota bacterium]|nr:WGR domain-containing protein [Candidatus Bipolaricaulota bacterium]